MIEHAYDKSKLAELSDESFDPCRVLTCRRSAHLPPTSRSGDARPARLPGRMWLICATRRQSALSVLSAMVFHHPSRNPSGTSAGYRCRIATCEMAVELSYHQSWSVG